MIRRRDREVTKPDCSTESQAMTPHCGVQTGCVCVSADHRGMKSSNEKQLCQLWKTSAVTSARTCYQFSHILVLFVCLFFYTCRVTCRIHSCWGVSSIQAQKKNSECSEFGGRSRLWQKGGELILTVPKPHAKLHQKSGPTVWVRLVGIIQHNQRNPDSELDYNQKLIRSSSQTDFSQSMLIFC